MWMRQRREKESEDEDEDEMGSVFAIAPDDSYPLLDRRSYLILFFRSSVPGTVSRSVINTQC
jgi:hypothetical protein